MYAQTRRSIGMQLPSRMKETKRINVVIGFTPFHALFAERLIDHLDGDTYCLFTKNWPQSKKPYKKVGFFLRGNAVLHGVSSALSYLYFSFFLRLVLRRIGEIHVYVPHPCNVFSNLAFFFKHVETVNIYEDGLLNYYDVDSGRGKVKVGQRVFSLICGAPYRQYRGHLAGYDARKVDVLYVSRREQVVAGEKVREVVQLDVPSENINMVKGRVLFLDQDVRSFISESRRGELIDMMLENYPSEHYEYIYKGHHDFNAPKIKMSILQDDLAGLPAELVVSKLRPEIVVSFFSSALLNIATGFSNITCVSLAASDVPITRDGVPCSLADVFVHSGVTCFSMEESSYSLSGNGSAEELP